MRATFVIPVLASILILGVIVPVTVFAITEDAKLIALDGARFHGFDHSISISGDSVIVGAPFDGSPQSGSAYIFTGSGTTWTQQAKLKAPDPTSSDKFGGSVSISGDTVIVGVRGDDDRGESSGSAYVFTRSGTTWTQQAKLTASDGARFDGFGNSVSISGDSVIVAAEGDDGAVRGTGAAYVFTRTGTTWTEQAKLTASDAALDDRFGFSVSISGDTAIVGATDDDDAGSDSGSAYVFTRTGTTWTEQAKLTASNAEAIDTFGISVSISGDTAIVGAKHGDSDAVPDSGAAYVFSKPISGWITATETAKLTASDASFQEFGFSVAVSGDTAVIGALRDSGAASRAGAAYVFTSSGTTWTEKAKLTASDAAASDLFGSSVAVSGDTAVVVAFQSGSAYVFDLSNNSPDCSGAIPSQDEMLQDMVWPPNHKMNSISISGVTDPDGDPISINIDGITQDEPTSGTGSGDQSPDGSGVGTDTAQLRAERSGSGDGRVYEVTFTADDGNGGTCTGSVNVSVPQSQNGNAAVDSGQTFDSTVP